MTTTEKLQRIKKRCEELLALAARRTPGEWCNRIHGWVKTEEPNSVLVSVGHHNSFDAAYIAACAGSAEAGWRNIINRIKFCQHLREYASDQPWLMGDVGREEESIITDSEGML